MKIEDAKVGLTVVRSKGDYVVGRTGTILAIKNDRVQVEWHYLSKSWVNVKVIEPTSIPYEIREVDLSGKVMRYPKYWRL